MPRRKRIPIGKILVVSPLLLAVAAGIHVTRWGRPLAPAFQSAGPNQWRAGDGTVIETRDTNGDGTWDELLVNGPAVKNRIQRLRETQDGGRLLIVCLDGVPYGELRTLWEQGHFRQFSAPVELVSTFPSDTEPAMTSVLRAPDAPGYENRFFDRKRGKLVGGPGVTLAQSSPYLKRLDYDEPAPLKGAQYFAPVKTYRADLGRLRKRFLASPSPVFIGHIATTDGLYHVMPPSEIRPLLVEADAMLRDLLFEARGNLRIVLFSDHGNDLTPSRPAPLRQGLESAGYNWATAIASERDVAVPKYGLVSFAAAYARPEAIPGVAEALSRTEGVELVAYHAPGGTHVRTRDAVAALEFDLGAMRFRYKPESGDPLELRPVFDKLRAEDKLDERGFAAEQDLFAETVGGHYPDALYRIADWATEGRSPIENRSDIMVSLQPGYYSGSGLFDKLVKLHSTHGGLNRGATLGFAMSTDGRLTSAQRYDQLLTPYLK